MDLLGPTRQGRPKEAIRGIDACVRGSKTNRNAQGFSSQVSPQRALHQPVLRDFRNGGLFPRPSGLTKTLIVEMKQSVFQAKKGLEYFSRVCPSY